VTQVDEHTRTSDPMELLNRALIHNDSSIQRYLRRMFGDNICVKQEPVAVVFDRADLHESLYWERVTPALFPEAQGIQSFPHFTQSPCFVKYRRIHDAFARTTGHRCAANMFHRDNRESGLDQLSRPCATLMARGS
jgi:hypothetical protein